jgi:hypothetical protein
MKKLVALLFIVVLTTAAVVAQQADIPLRNWTVPPYTVSSSDGIHTMVDATPPRLFIGLPPCRLLDTRPGTLYPLDGDGAFAANEARNYTLPGSCGIPTGTDAVSLNISVTGTQANPFGFIKIWPQGGAEPTVSTLNWTAAGQTLANAAIVPLSAGGGITVRSGNAGTDLIIDVNGYFSDTLGTPANYLRLENNSTGYTAFFTNSSTTCGGACGIFASTASGTAIWGNALDTVGTAIGVYGEINTLTNNSAGVSGFSDNSSGVTYGVLGRNDSVTNNSAGVRGTSGPIAASASWQNAGVRGETGVDAHGVLGISQTYGTTGVLVNAAGTPLVQGYLGRVGGDSVGCGGILQPLCPPNWAVFAIGDIGATGTKFFLDPHPTDASKVIGYISLEGPEAGTYFRGRARFENGMARIAVPEHFRMVTDPEGLTVQITPIGGMATVGVLRMDLNEIVVESSRNLEFSYLVQGVRATFKDVPTVWQGNEFRPERADATIPAGLSEGQRARLIANGTYRADGTVNMETATRLGWDKIWERQRPAPQPEQP